MSKIKAGQTEAYCGETIRILHIDDEDPDEHWIEGLTGKITHPFPGLMVPGVPSTDYIAGVWLDPYTHAGQTLSTDKTNLLVGDTFEVIDASTAEDYPIDPE